MTSYDWEASGATALVVPVLEAEAAIGRLRQAHTPSGREGMYAHATLLVPFIHGSQLSASDSRLVGESLAAFESFDVTLEAFGRFEEIGCIWLRPDPSGPFVAMSEVLLAAYPELEYPPEGLAITPHVTIGSHLSREELEQIEAEVAPHLPIRARIDHVALAERGEDGRWFDREIFRLA